MEHVRELTGVGIQHSETGVAQSRDPGAASAVPAGSRVGAPRSSKGDIRRTFEYCSSIYFLF